MTFPYDRSDFISFLLAAKRSTYAAGGGTPVSNPLVPGSKQLEYRSGSIFYRDIYFGNESIARSGVRVYELHYSGGWLR